MKVKTARQRLVQIFQTEFYQSQSDKLGLVAGNSTDMVKPMCGFPCVYEHRTMKTYGVLNIKLHVFFTSAGE
jgi:hypothetical protein